MDDDFPEYNELEGFRVLAVQAEPPTIAFGEDTTLSALVFVEDGDAGDVDYEWSWCPARLPSAVGGECAIDEALVAGLGLGEVSFDLGQEPTATFTHAVPEDVLGALCNSDADASGDLDAGVDDAAHDGEDDGQGFLLDCSQGVPISVQLVARRGDATITTIKELRLLRAGDPRNENPRIDGLSHALVPEGTAEDDVEDVVREDDATAVADDGDSELKLGEWYRMFADVPDDAAEMFTRPPRGFETEGQDKLENLAISWFVSAGSTERERTAFTDGTSEFSDLFGNTWKLPKSGDRDPGPAQIFLIIRDERGGIGWLQRTVELTR
jgi:hypothetical protein